MNKLVLQANLGINQRGAIQDPPPVMTNIKRTEPFSALANALKCFEPPSPLLLLLTMIVKTVL